EEKLEKRNIKFITDLPKKIKIAFDETLLLLSFEEVLKNAIKFTPDNSSVKTSIEVKKEQIDIIVEDEGIGLDRHELESIWEIGYENLKKDNRSSGFYAFRASGVGIGLTLVKKYLRVLGGDCKIESQGRCGAVSICSPEKCPAASHEESICNENVRYECKYICKGDTKKCHIIAEKLGIGCCPGTKMTLTLPLTPI
ncbi:MAG: ATP-binding protein, partial [Nitrospinae bacterium]|nr:ATP-binding protein [Nitrospinota bacterium]